MNEERKLFLIRLINNECDNNRYEIFEFDEVLSEFPKKLKVSKNILNKLIKNCEIENLISIKYTDESVFCATILNAGKQLVSKNETQNVRKNKLNNAFIYFLIAFSAFLGSFLAIILHDIIFG